jgi:hypothetical protein
LAVSGQNPRAVSGKIQPLLGLELPAIDLGPLDHQDRARLVERLDMPGEAPVIDIDPVADGEPVDDLRYGAGCAELEPALPRRSRAAEQHPIPGMELLPVGGDLDLRRPAFWPGDAHEDLDLPIDGPSRIAHMGHHGSPCRLVVMGAIDANRIHTPLGEIEDMAGIERRLGRERDQDTAQPAVQRRAEQGLRIGEKASLAAEELPLRRELRRRRRPRLRHAAECRSDGVQCRQDAAFQPAQGGEAVAHEGALQPADVAMPQGQVMSQIQGAGPEDGPMDIRAPGLEHAPPLGGDRNPQIRDLAAQLDQVRVVPVIEGLSHQGCHHRPISCRGCDARRICRRDRRGGIVTARFKRGPGIRQDRHTI